MYMYIYISELCVYTYSIYIHIYMSFRAFMLSDWLQDFWLKLMWHRYLESIVFALTSASHRPTPGLAEWILFGLFCYIIGVCCGCIATALCCSSRLRRLLVAVLVEGHTSTALDRPPREDQLAGFRLHRFVTFGFH